jgi:hypothetical protein
MSNLATQIAIVLCILLAAWYVVGWQLNRRRGERLLEWVIRALRASGEQVTVTRLGTSGFQVNVKRAHAPFEAMEATVLLQPREILLLWILNLLRGRADSLVVRGTLRTPPRGDVEAAGRKSPLAGRLMKGIGESGWSHQETPSGLMVASRGKGGHQQAEAISHLVEDLSPRLVRLSLSKKAPHVLANLSMAGMDEQTVALVLSSLRNVAQTVASGRR